MPNLMMVWCKNKEGVPTHQGIKIFKTSGKKIEHLNTKIQEAGSNFAITEKKER